MSDAPVFERVAREAAHRIGCSLFTATAFDADALQVQRVWSSDPAAYPVGGRKAKRDTEFGRRVLLAGELMVTEGDAAIARIFDDHAVILGLGLHSAINAPVVRDGRCLGVLNFLMRAAQVRADQVSAAAAFAGDPAVAEALRARMAH